ncbi:MAG: GNAT family N-acetyltransferase [Chloroflexi bacterium]|nr:GNAT family N-acetyltransferase [Chloroflexota bacterium]
MLTASPVIESLNPKTASDQEYAALNRFGNILRAERLPNDPPMPLEEEIQRGRNIPPFVDVKFWATRRADSAEIIATALTAILRTGDNEHVAQFEIEVLPEMRRQGLGRQLLARVAGTAKQEGRRLMITDTSERIPAGEAFMRRLGAAMGLATHVNQLDLAELNHDLVRLWLEQAPQRAPGFEIGFWPGAYPEEDLQAIAELNDVMNTAPRDRLEVDDMHFTPEQLRQMEQANAQRGVERWTMYTRETQSRAFAGFTDVYWHPNRPQILNQGNTGVFPRYRSKGLGRWLKAAMIEKVLRDRPEVRYIRTGNADSNEPMLKINTNLGFKPYQSQCVWQVETDKVLDYLRQAGETVE